MLKVQRLKVKCPASAVCRVAFEVCTIALMTCHFDVPLADVLGSQRIEMQRSYKSILYNFHKLAEL
jgi:hypothetical protein